MHSAFPLSIPASRRLDRARLLYYPGFANTSIISAQFPDRRMGAPSSESSPSPLSFLQGVRRLTSLSTFLSWENLFRKEHLDACTLNTSLSLVQLHVAEARST
jgi:hypothetical protein